MEATNPLSVHQSLGLMPSQMSLPAQMLSPMQLDDNSESAENVPELEFDHKLHNLIIQHLTDTRIAAVRKVLAPIANTLDCRDVLIAEAAMLLGQATREDMNLLPNIPEEKIIYDIIIKVIERIKKEKERQQDDLLTDIIIGLNQMNMLSPHASLLLMISSIDSRMIIPLSTKKIDFIKQQLEIVNYKSVKEVVKTAFLELNNLAPVITEKALNDFRPFEVVLLETLERKNNFAPLLLMKYEISKVNCNHPAYIMRRIADKVRDIEKSFRPLAILSELIGKPYLFPAFAHPSSTSMNHWKEDNRKNVKANLPHSTCNQSPQTFFQYTMLKQPWYLVRFETKDAGKERIPINCTEVLLILILEAMAAMEGTDLPIEHPLNQFNWQHLSYVGVVCWSESYVDFELLLGRLHLQLSELKYRKARGELMRLVLQYVALVQTGSNDSGQNDALSFYSKLKDLYNLLYPEDMVDTSVAADTECLKLGRYFAPAEIWLNFEVLRSEKTAQTDPPQNLIRQIKIIKEIMNSEKSKEDGFSTVIANAYTRDRGIFGMKFCANIIEKLERVRTNKEYTLPYGIHALKGKSALSVGVLESLNFSASKELMKCLWNQIVENLRRDVMPSPEMVESLARISFVGEINGCLGFMVEKFLNVTKELTGRTGQPQDNRSTHQHYSILMVLLEYFSRLKVLSSPHFYVYFYCLYDLIRFFTDDPGCMNHQFYIATEEMFAKWFLWCPSLPLIQLTQTFKSITVKRASLNLSHGSKQFESGDSSSSPELIKLYLFQLLKTNKLVNQNQKSAMDWISTYLTDVMKYHTFPESTVKWIPKIFKPVICEEMDISHLEMLIQLSGTDIEHFINMDENYFHGKIQQRVPSLFISFFRIIREDIMNARPMNFPTFAYDILKGISMRYLLLNLNSLIDYLLLMVKKAKSVHDSVSIQQLCTAMNNFIFEYQFITFDKFLYQFLLHPNDDESIKNGVEFIQYFIRDNHYLNSRFKALNDFLPLWSHMSFCDSTEYFAGMKNYYQQFPEYTYNELSQKSRNNEFQFQIPRDHLAVYYSNLLEKLIVSVEFLFFRLIEMEIPSHISMPIMDRFISVFRYHPQPASFLYKTLYYFQPELIRHDWIRKYVKTIALQDREHKYYLLSECFIDRYEVSTPTEICKVLIDRIKKSTTYKHQPPLFCSKDWRFAELPLAAATLVGANIELMINKFETNILIDALLKCGFKRPLEKPFEVMNAIGLILTTLPESFQRCFVEKFEAYIEMDELAEDEDPSKLLQSFSIDGYLAVDNDPLTALAIIHSYTQHCSNSGLVWLYELIESMHLKVKTEPQLMFLLRIIVPLFSRDIDIKKKVDLAVNICNSIINVVRNKNNLEYCDTYCDLLYEVKYVFQITDRGNIEELIKNFPHPLKDKMKYFFSLKEEHEQKIKQITEKEIAVLQYQRSQQMLRANPQLSFPYQNPSSQTMMPSSVQSGQDIQSIKPGIPFSSMRNLSQMDLDPQSVQIREKVEPEMVAPPVRADSLSEMSYQQKILQPPATDGGMSMQNMVPGMGPGLQPQRPMMRPPMLQSVPSSGSLNIPPTHGIPSSQGMGPPQNIPPVNQMNPMNRYPSMNPVMSQSMSQTPFMQPSTSGMATQGSFVPNQQMYMPPSSSVNNQPLPHSIPDNMPMPYNMMGQGQNPSMPPMSMPNQGGIVPHNQGGMMSHHPGMVQPGMQPPTQMMSGMHPPNYQFPQNMRHQIPPYNMPPGGMQPPR